MDPKLESKLKEKKTLKGKLYQLEREILQVKRKINIIEDDIMRSCQHNWIRDPDYTPAPYEKPDKICTICGSIDYRW